MTKTAKKPLPENSTARAGILLLGLATYVSITGRSDDTKIKATAKKALELAGEDAKHANGNAPDMMRVLAAQQAALAIQEACISPDPSGTQKMFDTLVENYRGGPRTVDLGGPMITNKKTVLKNWLRTAAYVIWKERPDLRDQLALDAKRLLGISSKKKLAKMVDNMKQGTLDAKAEHEDLVEALYNAGWTSLNDFC